MNIRPVPVISFLLVIALAATVYLVRRSDVPPDNTPVTGLPWQIERLADGNTRVFGIIPGVTTLDEATAVLGNDMDLALIAAPGEAGSLEAYYGHYSAGPLTGRLILVMDVSARRIADMRANALREGASYRFRLDPEDLAAVWRLPVRVVTFAPSIDLDEEIVSARFGKPEVVLEAGAQQAHWLYPERGLDLVLDGNGKEVLQYLSPRAFPAWQEQLRQRQQSP